MAHIPALLAQAREHAHLAESLLEFDDDENSWATVKPEEALAHAVMALYYAYVGTNG